MPYRFRPILRKFTSRILCVFEDVVSGGIQLLISGDTARFACVPALVRSMVHSLLQNCSGVLKITGMMSLN